MTVWILIRRLGFQSSRSLRTATMVKANTFHDNYLFQSSRSLRTATFIKHRITTPRKIFNPRGPCGPRQHIHGLPDHAANFSILAVLADRDLWGQLRLHPGTTIFNPRGPCGPRRLCGQCSVPRQRFFNPRGPCGPRHRTNKSRKLRRNFQSSRSLRTATKPMRRPGEVSRFSILAVLADRDTLVLGDEFSVQMFSILAVLADRDTLRSL